MRASPISHLPALRGGLLALFAAFLFGASTPLVQKFGEDVGAFTTAALLYVGAAVVGWMLRQPVDKEARLRRADCRCRAPVHRTSHERNLSCLQFKLKNDLI